MITQEKINNSICSIQQGLGIEETGEWDDATIAALKNFQMRMKISPNGIPDIYTITELVKRTGIIINEEQPKDSNIEDLDITTDLMETPMKIIEKLLPPDQYNSDLVKKFDYIFIHHTAGWDNPEKVVDDWASDERGRIGVHYIIGGQSITNKFTNDGKIIKCIPDYNWASHLGSQSKDGISFVMHKNSIGIELCNFGYLTKIGLNYFTYSNTKVDPKQVLDLGYKFRGYQYWHNYSDLQIESLKLLIKKLGDQFKIDITSGLKKWLVGLSSTEYHKAFEYSPDATAGKIKGLLSHTNVRKDKTDVYPHPKLIQMIMSL